jgi:hypothetical protein
MPTPNPLRSVVTIPVTLGAEGSVQMRLYTASGAVILARAEERAKGPQQLTLDVAGVPSGFYVLEVESWGWRERRNVLILN